MGKKKKKSAESHEKRQHICLIGMPTSGKTVIGRRLAARRGIDFVDLDDRIAQAAGEATLQPVVDKLSAAEFAALEERVAIETIEGLTRPTVIATGGSVVYSERAMRALKKGAVIIHLKASFKVIERRIAEKPNRGIVYAPGETLRMLYDRRMPLYDRWADITVRTDNNRARVARQLAERRLAA